MSTKDKKYGPKAALDAQEIERLLVELDEEIFDGSDETKVIALAEHLVKAQDVDHLVALHHAADTRRLQKEVNKALYRLKQRGLAVPDLKERPEAVQIAAGPIEVDDIEVLVAIPEVDGQRDFLFAHPRGRLLLGVESTFQVPIGLTRLAGFRSSRVHFRKYIHGLTTRKSPRMRELPSYVLAGGALRKRKLWEIGTLVKDKKLGPKVDRALLETFELPERPPLHPAWDLDLSSARALSIEELGALKAPLRPFYHPGAYARLRSQVEEWKSESVIQSQGEESSPEDKLFTAIGDWAQQWGFDAIAELLLDSAIFYHAAGLPDVALAFREVVNAPRIDPRDRQIHAFLLDVWKQIK